MCNYDRNQVEVAYIYHVAKFYDTIENILKVPMYTCGYQFYSWNRIHTKKCLLQKVQIALPDEVNILVRSDKKKLYLI